MKDSPIEIEQCSELRIVVQSTPARLARATLILAAALLAAAVSWATLCKVDLVIKAPCTVRPTTHPVTVQTAVAGEIESVRFREGQRVHCGDVLVVIGSARVEGEISKHQSLLESADAQLVLLEEMRAGLNREEQRLQGKAARDVETSEIELRGARERLARVEADAGVVRSSRGEAERKRAQADHLVSSGVSSRSHLDEAEAALSEARGREQCADAAARAERTSVELAERRLSAAREACTAAVDEFHNRARELELRRSSARGDRERLARDLDALRHDLALCTIKSPVDGVVTEGAPVPGDVIARGNVVARIASGGLQIEALVPNADCGGLRLGQEARVKLDAYDYQRFGSARAVIEYVAPDSTEIAAPSGTRLSGYAVRLRLHQATLGPSMQPIELGMTGMLEVITGEERVMSIAFRKVRNKVGV